MSQRKAENEYAILIEENGIVYSTFKMELINLEIAKEIIKFRLEFTNNEPTIIFIDSSKVKTICKDSRDYFGSKEGTENLIAVAILTKSKLSVFLANFLLKVNLKSSKTKIKLFSEKEKAVLWLKTFQK
jgi:hypothetical protein